MSEGKKKKSTRNRADYMKPAANPFSWHKSFFLSFFLSWVKSSFPSIIVSQKGRDSLNIFFTGKAVENSGEGRR